MAFQTLRNVGGTFSRRAADTPVRDRGRVNFKQARPVDRGSENYGGKRAENRKDCGWRNQIVKEAQKEWFGGGNDPLKLFPFIECSTHSHPALRRGAEM